MVHRDPGGQVRHTRFHAAVLQHTTKPISLNRDEDKLSMPNKLLEIISPWLTLLTCAALRFQSLPTGMRAYETPVDADTLTSRSPCRRRQSLAPSLHQNLPLICRASSCLTHHLQLRVLWYDSAICLRMACLTPFWLFTEHCSWRQPQSSCSICTCQKFYGNGKIPCCTVRFCFLRLCTSETLRTPSLCRSVSPAKWAPTALGMLQETPHRSEPSTSATQAPTAAGVPAEAMPGNAARQAAAGGSKLSAGALQHFDASDSEDSEAEGLMFAPDDE